MAEAATSAEWLRFLSARSNDPVAAQEMWAAHVAWRKANLPLPKDAPSLGNKLPELVKMLDGRCRAGNRVLVVLGAMYDNTTYGAAEYSLAIAAKFDETLDRESDEKITVSSIAS